MTGRRLIGWTIALVFVLAVQAGCPERPTDIEDQSLEETSTAPPPLKVLIVDTPGIDNEIKRQWSARRDGQLETQQATWDEVAADEFSLVDQYDVVIYPGGLLGEFVSRKKLVQVPGTIWEAELLNKREILRLPRTSLVRFGQDIWGMPLGSPQFCLFYRRDLLESTDTSLPSTWPAFVELVAESETPEEAADSVSTIRLPLQDDWAARCLLAFAASRVKHRGKVSSVFDLDSMEPLIDHPPFVDALDELRRIADPADLQRTPESIYADLVAGKTTFGVTWPSAAFDIGESKTNVDLAMAQLPGTNEWFDFDEKQFSQREDRRANQVVLVGFNARMVSVSAGTSKQEAAFELATWLASKQISQLIVPRTPSAAPFRASHLGGIARWTGDGISPDTQEAYADLLRETDQSMTTLLVPRIPGYDEYLGALAAAVHTALTSDEESAALLTQVAEQWREITERLGKEDQRRWLRRSEGF